MAHNDSVARWMKMDITSPSNARFLRADSVWATNALEALPIPEIFGCCSTNGQMGETKLGPENQVLTQFPTWKKEVVTKGGYRIYTGSPPKKSDPRWASSWLRAATMEEQGGSPAERRDKKVGKSISAADARKMLQQMGVDDKVPIDIRHLEEMQYQQSAHAAGNSLDLSAHPRVRPSGPNIIQYRSALSPGPVTAPAPRISTRVVPKSPSPETAVGAGKFPPGGLSPAELVSRMYNEYERLRAQQALRPSQALDDSAYLSSPSPQPQLLRTQEFPPRRAAPASPRRPVGVPPLLLRGPPSQDAHARQPEPHGMSGWYPAATVAAAAGHHTPTMAPSPPLPPPHRPAGGPKVRVVMA